MKLVYLDLEPVARPALFVGVTFFSLVRHTERVSLYRHQARRIAGLTLDMSTTYKFVCTFNRDRRHILQRLLK
jgi:hypothetical protein